MIMGNKQIGSSCSSCGNTISKSCNEELTSVSGGFEAGKMGPPTRDERPRLVVVTAAPTRGLLRYSANKQSKSLHGSVTRMRVIIWQLIYLIILIKPIAATSNINSIWLSSNDHKPTPQGEAIIKRVEQTFTTHLLKHQSHFNQPKPQTQNHKHDRKQPQRANDITTKKGDNKFNQRSGEWSQLHSGPLQASPSSLEPSIVDLEQSQQPLYAQKVQSGDRRIDSEQTSANFLGSFLRKPSPSHLGQLDDLASNSVNDNLWNPSNQTNAHVQFDEEHNLASAVNTKSNNNQNSSQHQQQHLDSQFETRQQDYKEIASSTLAPQNTSSSNVGAEQRQPDLMEEPPSSVAILGNEEKVLNSNSPNSSHPHLVLSLDNQQRQYSGNKNRLREQQRQLLPAPIVLHQEEGEDEDYHVHVAKWSAPIGQPQQQANGDNQSTSYIYYLQDGDKWSSPLVPSSANAAGDERNFRPKQQQQQQRHGQEFGSAQGAAHSGSSGGTTSAATTSAAGGLNNGRRKLHNSGTQYDLRERELGANSILANSLRSSSGASGSSMAAAAVEVVTAALDAAAIEQQYGVSSGDQGFQAANQHTNGKDNRPEASFAGSAGGTTDEQQRRLNLQQTDYSGSGHNNNRAAAATTALDSWPAGRPPSVSYGFVSHAQEAPSGQLQTSGGKAEGARGSAMHGGGGGNEKGRVASGGTMQPLYAPPPMPTTAPAYLYSPHEYLLNRASQVVEPVLLNPLGPKQRQRQQQLLLPLAHNSNSNNDNSQQQQRDLLAGPILGQQAEQSKRQDSPSLLLWPHHPQQQQRQQPARSSINRLRQSPYLDHTAGLQRSLLRNVPMLSYTKPSAGYTKSPAKKSLLGALGSRLNNWVDSGRGQQQQAQSLESSFYENSDSTVGGSGGGGSYASRSRTRTRTRSPAVGSIGSSSSSGGGGKWNPAAANYHSLDQLQQYGPTALLRPTMAAYYPPLLSAGRISISDGYLSNLHNFQSGAGIQQPTVAPAPSSLGRFYGTAEAAVPLYAAASRPRGYPLSSSGGIIEPHLGQSSHHLSQFVARKSTGAHETAAHQQAQQAAAFIPVVAVSVTKTSPAPRPMSAADSEQHDRGNSHHSDVGSEIDEYLEMKTGAIRQQQQRGSFKNQDDYGNLASGSMTRDSSLGQPSNQGRYVTSNQQQQQQQADSVHDQHTTTVKSAVFGYFPHQTESPMMQAISMLPQYSPTKLAAPFAGYLQHAAAAAAAADGSNSAEQANDSQSQSQLPLLSDISHASVGFDEPPSLALQLQANNLVQNDIAHPFFDPSVRGKTFQQLASQSVHTNGARTMRPIRSSVFDVYPTNQHHYHGFQLLQADQLAATAAAAAAAQSQANLMNPQLLAAASELNPLLPPTPLMFANPTMNNVGQQQQQANQQSNSDQESDSQQDSQDDESAASDSLPSRANSQLNSNNNKKRSSDFFANAGQLLLSALPLLLAPTLGLMFASSPNPIARYHGANPFSSSSGSGSGSLPTGMPGAYINSLNSGMVSNASPTPQLFTPTPPGYATSTTTDPPIPMTTHRQHTTARPTRTATTTTAPNHHNKGHHHLSTVAPDLLSGRNISNSANKRTHAASAAPATVKSFGLTTLGPPPFVNETNMIYELDNNSNSSSLVDHLTGNTIILLAQPSDTLNVSESDLKQHYDVSYEGVDFDAQFATLRKTNAQRTKQQHGDYNRLVDQYQSHSQQQQQHNLIRPKDKRHQYQYSEVSVDLLPGRSNTSNGFEGEAKLYPVSTWPAMRRRTVSLVTSNGNKTLFDASDRYKPTKMRTAATKLEPQQSGGLASEQQAKNLTVSSNRLELPSDSLVSHRLGGLNLTLNSSASATRNRQQPDEEFVLSDNVDLFNSEQAATAARAQAPSVSRKRRQVGEQVQQPIRGQRHPISLRTNGPRNLRSDARSVPTKVVRKIKLAQQGKQSSLAKAFGQQLQRPLILDDSGKSSLLALESISGTRTLNPIEYELPIDTSATASRRLINQSERRADTAYWEPLKRDASRSKSAHIITTMIAQMNDDNEELATRGASISGSGDDYLANDGLSQDAYLTPNELKNELLRKKIILDKIASSSSSFNPIPRGALHHHRSYDSSLQTEGSQEFDNDQAALADFPNSIEGNSSTNQRQRNLPSATFADQRTRGSHYHSPLPIEVISTKIKLYPNGTEAKLNQVRSSRKSGDQLVLTDDTKKALANFGTLLIKDTLEVSQPTLGEQQPTEFVHHQQQQLFKKHMRIPANKYEGDGRFGATATLDNRHPLYQIQHNPAFPVGRDGQANINNYNYDNYVGSATEQSYTRTTPFPEPANYGDNNSNSNDVDRREVQLLNQRYRQQHQQQRRQAASHPSQLARLTRDHNTVEEYYNNNDNDSLHRKLALNEPHGSIISEPVDPQRQQQFIAKPLRDRVSLLESELAPYNSLGGDDSRSAEEGYSNGHAYVPTQQQQMRELDNSQRYNSQQPVEPLELSPGHRGGGGYNNNFMPSSGHFGGLANRTRSSNGADNGSNYNGDFAGYSNHSTLAPQDSALRQSSGNSAGSVGYSPYPSYASNYGLPNRLQQQQQGPLPYAYENSIGGRGYQPPPQPLSAGYSGASHAQAPNHHHQHGYFNHSAANTYGSLHNAQTNTYGDPQMAAYHNQKSPSSVQGYSHQSQQMNYHDDNYPANGYHQAAKSHYHLSAGSSHQQFGSPHTHSLAQHNSQQSKYSSYPGAAGQEMRYAHPAGRADHVASGYQHQHQEQLQMSLLPPAANQRFPPDLAYDGGLGALSGASDKSDSKAVNEYLKRVQFSDSDRDKLMASYLTCDGLLNDNDHCLERLSCEFSDPQNIEKANKLDRAVSSILLGHILINTYIPNQFKLRLKSASLFGYTQSGKCSRFTCNKLAKSSSSSSSPSSADASPSSAAAGAAKAASAAAAAA